jgi:hypothetical protein
VIPTSTVARDPTDIGNGNHNHESLFSANQSTLAAPSGAAVLGYEHDSYLVDPASSHMLVSKIKPCMSKYK